MQCIRALEKLRLSSPAGRTFSTLIQRMEDLVLPGVAVGYVHRSSETWANGYGNLRTDRKRPVTADTLFQAGSVSKIVFALAIMRLAQDGALDLDEDVQAYLKSWSVPLLGGRPCRVTLRHLLSHTAGATVHGFPGYPPEDDWPDVIDVLNGASSANTAPVKIDTEPGSHYRYSGGGTTIAQLAVSELLQRPFPQLMQDLVLEPTGMFSSTFEQVLPKELKRRAAIGHDENGMEVPGGWRAHPEMAAAGLWTTAADLTRLGTAVLGALSGDENPLGLSAASVRSMFLPQREADRDAINYVGLGWFCSGKDDGLICSHKGANVGYMAHFVLLPHSGDAVVVLINARRGAVLRDEIIHALTSAFDWPDTGATDRQDWSV